MAVWTISQINIYEIIERIGEGGFGFVYKAHDPALDRFVAIKVIRPEIESSPDFVERFRREARMTAMLRHPIQTLCGRLDQLHAAKPWLLELCVSDRLAKMESFRTEKDWPAVAEQGYELLQRPGLAEEPRKQAQALLSETYLWEEKQKFFTSEELQQILARIETALAEAAGAAVSKDILWLRGLLKYILWVEYEIGDWADVITDFDRAFANSPEVSEHSLWAGIAYSSADNRNHSRGDRPKALELKTRTIEQDPSQSYFYVSRGLIYHSAKKPHRSR